MTISANIWNDAALQRTCASLNHTDHLKSGELVGVLIFADVSHAKL